MFYEFPDGVNSYKQTGYDLAHELHALGYTKLILLARVTFNYSENWFEVIFSRQPEYNSVLANIKEMSGEIITIMKNNPQITIPRIAKLLGYTERTIYRLLAKLKSSGKIKRIAPDKSGYWENN